MRPAYAWDCDDCGRENFLNGVVPEFSEDELKYLRNEQGVSAYDAGYFVQMPDTVRCKHCGSQFETEYFQG